MRKLHFILYCVAYSFLLNGITAMDLGIPPCRVETALAHVAGNYGLKAIFIKNAKHETQQKGFFFGKDLAETLQRFNTAANLRPDSRIVAKNGLLFLSGTRLEVVLSQNSTEFKKISILGDEPEVCDLTAGKSESIKDVISRVYKAYPHYNCCEIVFAGTQPVQDIWEGGLLATLPSANSTFSPDIDSNVITLSFESVNPITSDSSDHSTERQIKTLLKSMDSEFSNPTYAIEYFAFFHWNILRKVLAKEHFWRQMPLRGGWQWEMPEILFRNNGDDPKVAEYIFDVFDKLSSVELKKQFLMMYFPDNSVLPFRLAKRMDRILSSNKSFQRAYLKTHVSKNLKWKGDAAPFDKNKPVISVPPTKVIRTSYLRLEFGKPDFSALSSDAMPIHLNLLKIKKLKKADPLLHSPKIGEMVYMIYKSDFTIGGIPPIRNEADIDLSTPEKAYLSSICARNVKWYAKCSYDAHIDDDPSIIHNLWSMWNSKLTYFIKISQKVEFKYDGEHYCPFSNYVL